MHYIFEPGSFVPAVSKLTVAAVNRVVARINLRPRKRLGWKTPYEVYAGAENSNPVDWTRTYYSRLGAHWIKEYTTRLPSNGSCEC